MRLNRVTKMTETEKIVHIDGSYGEGGGQILRTALAFSAILNRPIKMTRIRAGRKNPGLQPQHLKCIEALAKITKAVTEGVQIGSEAITFIPGKILPGNYEFDIGTAGSVTLLLQALLLPLSLSESSSQLVMTGGTHVEWSPPFHYLTEVLFPTLHRMGIEVKAKIERWGWYPKGRGRAVIEIYPASEIKPVALTDRGALKRIYGISAVSHLPSQIALRQRDQALKRIGEELELDVKIEVLSNMPSTGPGSFFFLVVESERAKAGFSSLGRKGRRAEEVADEAVDSLKAYLRSGASIDPYLADQLVPFMAFARGGSAFRTARITEHLLTNLWVIQHFLSLSVTLWGRRGESGTIDLSPAPY